MNKLMVKSRYDEECMGYVWYVVVGEVQTQGFDSPWHAVAAGVDILKGDDVDAFLWCASMCLSAIYNEPAIRVYKKLRDLIQGRTHHDTHPNLRRDRPSLPLHP